MRISDWSSDVCSSDLWIRKEFPDLFYIVSPGGYGAATWTGMNRVVDGIDNTTISNAWLATHIQQGHGPMGAGYPDVAYGMRSEEHTSELQSLMRISYAVFCLKKKKKKNHTHSNED